jgi:hypothetical protein
VGFVPAEAVDFDLVAALTSSKSATGRERRERIGKFAPDGVHASLPGYATTQSGGERSRTRVRRQTG